MKNSIIIFAALFFGLFAVALPAGAQENPFNIQFPINELGSCASLDECRDYCNNPTNSEACFSWAESQGIAVERPHDGEEEPINNGPGGCTTPRECHSYCEDERNMEECVNFAVSEGYMSQEEADKILRGGPGGCQGERECDAYCRNPQNSEKCIDFAVAEGFMTAEEADRIKAHIRGDFDRDFGPGPIGPGDFDDHGPEINKERVLEVLAQQGGPGGCANFGECEAFCNNPANDEECFDFAVEHDLFGGDAEEIERFKTLRETEGPGGCRGFECKAYCDGPGHESECLDFAVEHGLIRAEEAQRIKGFMQATLDGGPGGCRGRACEEYCNNPEHRDECFTFATENNLLSPEELAEIEKFRGIEEKIATDGGPGGCRSENECRIYCTDTTHFNECAAFAVQEGFLDPAEAERELRRFIEIEEFGAEGFHRGGFGSGGPSGGFGDIPPEFKEQFEREFELRRGEFEQYSNEFERRDFPREEGFFDGGVQFDGSREDFFGNETFIRDEQYRSDGFVPDQFPTPYNESNDFGSFDEVRTLIEQQKIEEIKSLEYLKELELRGISPEASYDGIYTSPDYPSDYNRIQEKEFIPESNDLQYLYENIDAVPLPDGEYEIIIDERTLLNHLNGTVRVVVKKVNRGFTQHHFSGAKNSAGFMNNIANLLGGLSVR